MPTHVVLVNLRILEVVMLQIFGHYVVDWATDWLSEDDKKWTLGTTVVFLTFIVWLIWSGRCCFGRLSERTSMTLTIVTATVDTFFITVFVPYLMAFGNDTTQDAVLRSSLWLVGTVLAVECIICVKQMYDPGPAYRTLSLEVDTQ